MPGDGVSINLCARHPHGLADENWSFAPIDGNTPVVFETSPDAQAAAKEAGFEFVAIEENGFASFQLKL